MLIWTTSYTAYRYPGKCLLITRIRGNVFRNELVSKNQSLRKRVCQLVSKQWVYMSQYILWRVLPLRTPNVTCWGTWPLLNTKCNLFRVSNPFTSRVYVTDHFWTTNVTCLGSLIPLRHVFTLLTTLFRVSNPFTSRVYVTDHFWTPNVTCLGSLIPLRHVFTLLTTLFRVSSPFTSCVYVTDHFV
jgi:hypothetical protein